MKKLIVCVFAHPDDEAFGPGGTIAALSQEYDVFILCATKGEAGIGINDLGKTRAEELKKSAKILGVKEVFFLGFKDGTLSNNLYHKLADAIREKVNKIKPEILLTFEPRGVSGHIDHITVSMATSFVFDRSKEIKKLYYYALPDWLVEKMNEVNPPYFVYFPPGYRSSDLNLVIDTSAVWQKKTEAMNCHQSQIKDVNRILNFQSKIPKKEYFIVLKNKNPLE